MAGIYIHIPFCKQACSYCNFHFSTSLKMINDFPDYLIKEMSLRKDFLQHQTVDTIYIGGGTPSLLTADQINRIIDSCTTYYDIIDAPEITVEANPDDLNTKYISDLLSTPINRFSIGIQSFHDIDLQFMNRAHTSAHAASAIQRVQDAGYTNLSVDLIFGNPTTTDSMWEYNLNKFINLNIPHLSCYALTVEEQTALSFKIKNSLIQPIDENRIGSQFEKTMQLLVSEAYEHYEISNYAKKGFRSRHNSNYWFNIPYLGLGPSAHSYDGVNRFQNVANNQKYRKNIIQEAPFIIQDILSSNDRYNEYIMTRIRTAEGISIIDIKDIGSRYLSHFTSQINSFIKDEYVRYHAEKYTLTKKGKLFADHISAELFITD